MPNPKQLKSLMTLLKPDEAVLREAAEKAMKSTGKPKGLAAFAANKAAQEGAYKAPKLDFTGKSAQEIKENYDSFKRLGATEYDPEMQRIHRKLMDMQDAASAKAQQVATRKQGPIEALAQKKANMVMGAGVEAPAPEQSLAAKLEQADKMGMQLGMGAIGADAEGEGESVNDIARAKAEALRKMLGMK